MIKGIIFDLDNCIFETRSMGESLIDPVLSAMHDHDGNGFLNHGKIKKELWSMSLADVIRLNNIPEKIAKKMRAAYMGLEAPDDCRAYGDAGHIKKLAATKILVTTGYRNFQLSKIRKAGIEPYFEKIIIDALDDPAAIRGKRKIFEEIMEKYGWKSDEALVVGDSPTSELAAGKALGAVTVQTLRPGVKKGEGFDHYIEGLAELGKIIAGYK